MGTLNFTQKQVTKTLSDIAVDKEGISKVLKIFLEALMRAERREHNESTINVSNDYSTRKVISNNMIFERRILCENLYSRIWFRLRLKQDSGFQVSPAIIDGAAMI